jgi:outer membrane protein OmpA-like peptidoglycan-associated protein
MSKVRIRVKGIMSFAAAVALGLLSAGSVMAQGYYGNPNVVVDPSVLDELGPPLNVADFVSPRPIVTSPYSENLAFSPPPRPTAPLASGPATPTPWGKKSSSATKKAPEKAAKPKPVAQAVVPKEPKKKAEPVVKKASTKPASTSAPAPLTAPTKPVEMAATQPAPLLPAIPAPAPPPLPPVAAAPPVPPAAPAAVAPPAPPAAPPVPAQAVVAPPSPPPAPLPTPLAAPEAPVLQPIKPVSPQVAALPDASAIGKSTGDTVQVLFPSGASKFADADKPQLRQLVDRMLKDENLRVELVAYAEGTDATANKARSLSLTRAQSIRGYLIDQGLRNSRVDMRVLGHKVKEGNPDRVDIVVLKK